MKRKSKFTFLYYPLIGKSHQLHFTIVLAEAGCPLLSSVNYGAALLRCDHCRITFNTSSPIPVLLNHTYHIANPQLGHAIETL